MKKFLLLLHHPLLISLFTVTIGGFGLYLVQNANAKHDAVLAKKLILVDDVVRYESRCGSVVRQMKNLIRLHHKINDTAEYRQANQKVQEYYDETRSLENSIRTRMWLYYSGHENSDRFESLSKALGNAVNDGQGDIDRDASDWPRAQEFLNEFFDLEKTVIFGLTDEMSINCNAESHA